MYLVVTGRSGIATKNVNHSLSHKDKLWVVNFVHFATFFKCFPV